MIPSATTMKGWQVGDVFTHRRWFSTKTFERAQCRVVALKRDSHKGQPICVVQVVEIGGTRTASYASDRVPCIFTPAEVIVDHLEEAPQ